MKAEIDATGCLSIIAENSTEEYAVKNWVMESIIFNGEDSFQMRLDSLSISRAGLDEEIINDVITEKLSAGIP